MHRKTTWILATSMLLAVSGCRTPVVEDSGYPDQTRFEQEEAGYPDRLNNSKEAETQKRWLKEKQANRPQG